MQCVQCAHVHALWCRLLFPSYILSMISYVQGPRAHRAVIPLSVIPSCFNSASVGRRDQGVGLRELFAGSRRALRDEHAAHSIERWCLLRAPHFSYFFLRINFFVLYSTNLLQAHGALPFQTCSSDYMIHKTTPRTTLSSTLHSLLLHCWPAKKEDEQWYRPNCLQ